MWKPRAKKQGSTLEKQEGGCVTLRIDGGKSKGQSREESQLRRVTLSDHSMNRGWTEGSAQCQQILWLQKKEERAMSLVIQCQERPHITICDVQTYWQSNSFWSNSRGLQRYCSLYGVKIQHSHRFMFMHLKNMLCRDFINMYSDRNMFVGFFKRIVHSKIKILTYSPSCRSKPARSLFIFGTQNKIFLIKSESSLTLWQQRNCNVPMQSM